MSLPTVLRPGFCSMTWATSSCAKRVCSWFIPVTKKVPSVMRLTVVMPAVPGRLTMPRSSPSRMGLLRRRSARACAFSCSVTSPALKDAAWIRVSHVPRDTGMRRRNHEARGARYLLPASIRSPGTSRSNCSGPSASATAFSTTSEGILAFWTLPAAPNSHEASKRALHASRKSAHASASSSPRTCEAKATRYDSCAFLRTVRRCLSSSWRVIACACGWRRSWEPRERARRPRPRCLAQAARRGGCPLHQQPPCRRGRLRRLRARRARADRAPRAR